VADISVAYTSGAYISALTAAGVTGLTSAVVTDSFIATMSPTSAPVAAATTTFKKELSRVDKIIIAVVISFVGIVLIGVAIFFGTQGKADSSSKGDTGNDKGMEMVSHPPPIALTGKAHAAIGGKLGQVPDELT